MRVDRRSLPEVVTGGGSEAESVRYQIEYLRGDDECAYSGICN